MKVDDLPIDFSNVAEVLRRHAGHGPRYTSYPPATAWSDAVGPADLRAALQQACTHAPAPMSVYVHVPFCPSQCYFCACNVLITPRTDLANAYLDRVEREVDMLAPHLPQTATTQVHWGGGSPSYLTPEQMRRLHGILARRFSIVKDAEQAIEADPRITSQAHLEALRDLGFNRLSMGVQDFDSIVQTTIHREQSAELTENFMKSARELGFLSLNVDLIYGLPQQTLESFGKTLARIIEMAPDRIAVYGYAHVPWMKPFQRRFTPESLPDAPQRFALFQLALERLTAAGYDYIGMDHFARPEDELALARKDGTLQRNFMGYTTQGGTNLVGIGLSSISFVDGLYAQNERKLNPYYGLLDRGELPTVRGWQMTADDRVRNDVIQALMCEGVVDKARIGARHGVDFDTYFADGLARLKPLMQDGLLEIDAERLYLTGLGRILVRPVAMCFDAWLPAENATGQRFSATV